MYWAFSPGPVRRLSEINSGGEPGGTLRAVTLGETLSETYVWLSARSLYVLLAAVAIPALGTLLAWIGKGGKTDTDGRLIANLVIGVGLFATVLELLAVAIGIFVSGVSLFDANVVLLVAPIVCLVTSALGIRLVFPLSELGTVQAATDFVIFVLTSLAAVWLLSRFRGWGLYFLGTFTQMLLFGCFVVAMLYVMFRRAVRRSQ